MKVVTSILLIAFKWSFNLITKYLSKCVVVDVCYTASYLSNALSQEWTKNTCFLLNSFKWAKKRSQRHTSHVGAFRESSFYLITTFLLTLFMARCISINHHKKYNKVWYMNYKVWSPNKSLSPFVKHTSWIENKLSLKGNPSKAQ